MPMSENAKEEVSKIKKVGVNFEKGRVYLEKRICQKGVVLGKNIHKNGDEREREVEEVIFGWSICDKDRWNC